ncbi:hypothetical protein BLA18112_00734 [Burkholderia lata]|uniref:Uncharacterized protein n=1 Tax=Burkholderia lata (strain ATCC 17760 / DSM 23089 / LMG 22485 / NCIMB 9086 / R18194 / 383) TaxID=482957 RepID=A0A6P2TNZ8_BURL3|nr:hypothetical protein [Burkholderia lata]VWC59257.1 hypothetical protein BLA18112_00734 [Burkholderia lata]
MLAKRSTVFAYLVINVDGETAVLRADHHKGVAVIEDGDFVSDKKF